MLEAILYTQQPKTKIFQIFGFFITFPNIQRVCRQSIEVFGSKKGKFSEMSWSSVGRCLYVYYLTFECHLIFFKNFNFFLQNFVCVFFKLVKVEKSRITEVIHFI